MSGPGEKKRLLTGALSNDARDPRRIQIVLYVEEARAICQDLEDVDVQGHGRSLLEQLQNAVEHADTTPSPPPPTMCTCSFDMRTGRCRDGHDTCPRHKHEPEGPAHRLSEEAMEVGAALFPFLSLVPPVEP